MGVFFMEPLRALFVDWRQSLKSAVASTRRLVYSMVCLGMVVFSALMIWRFLTVATCSESPIVVVLSGSMRPAFERGDLLLLTLLDEEPYVAGDVIVFKVEGREIPIVHRITESHRKKDDNTGGFHLLTKGDANHVDDRQLYDVSQRWVERRHILGKARANLPFIGMVTILMNDYPYLKFCLLGGLGLLALANRDE